MRRHDVGGRKNSFSTQFCLFQNLIVSAERIIRIAHHAEFLLKKLPGADAVKDFIKKDAKKNLIRRLIAAINDISDQILADAVACTIDIGKFMRNENRVICPRGRFTLMSAEKYFLSFGCELPVGVINLGGCYWR